MDRTIHFAPGATSGKDVKLRLSARTAERIRTIVLILCALIAWAGACIDSTATIAVSALAAIPLLLASMKGGER